MDAERPAPPLGVHCLLDLEGLAPELLADADALERALVAAAERGGARVISRHFHRFAPHGTSGVVILAESHLAVHTWPERGFAAVDVFTCGDPGADLAGGVAERIAEEVVAALRPARQSRRRLVRGPAAAPAGALGPAALGAVR